MTRGTPRPAKEAARRRITGWAKGSTNYPSYIKNEPLPRNFLPMIKDAIAKTNPEGASESKILRYIEINHDYKSNYKLYFRKSLYSAVKRNVLGMKSNKYFIFEDHTPSAKRSKKVAKKSKGDGKRKKSTSIKGDKTSIEGDGKRKKSTSIKGDKKRKKTNSKRKEKSQTGNPKKSTKRSTSASSLKTPKQRQQKVSDTDSTSKKLVWAWQFLENDTNYHNYDKEANDLVESVYQEYLSNPNRVDVNAVQSGQWKYMVDFRNMTQTNIQHENHTVRQIRRIQIPVSEVNNKKKAYKR